MAAGPSRAGSWRPAPVTLGWFLPGHDQKALHDRVAKIGTVHEFIHWFDRTFTEDVRSMSSRIESITPHANSKDVCSAHSAAAGCGSLIADVVLSDAGSEHVVWAVCARWLQKNPEATAWLGTHPEAAALLGAF
ncbi:hypothetical protein ACFW9O_30955 [Streptomyces sp. NPDC059499]|uniref:hypothetical protein n=1 Tax=Streptomyces sp. NPDC059499 TaxID=3346852 RepID=UPI0036C58CB9